MRLLWRLLIINQKNKTRRNSLRPSFYDSKLLAITATGASEANSKTMAMAINFNLVFRA